MTEIFMQIQELLRPEMYLITVFCYVLGRSLKASERFSNNDIPLTLVIMGACTGAMYIFALDPRMGFLGVIVGFLQGAIAGFASTGFHETKRNINS